MPCLIFNRLRPLTVSVLIRFNKVWLIVNAVLKRFFLNLVFITGKTNNEAKYDHGNNF